MFGFVDLPKELPPPYSEKDELKIKAEGKKRKKMKKEKGKKKRKKKNKGKEKKKKERRKSCHLGFDTIICTVVTHINIVSVYIIRSGILCLQR